MIHSIECEDEENVAPMAFRTLSELDTFVFDHDKSATDQLLLTYVQ